MRKAHHTPPTDKARLKHMSKTLLVSVDTLRKRYVKPT